VLPEKGRWKEKHAAEKKNHLIARMDQLRISIKLRFRQVRYMNHVNRPRLGAKSPGPGGFRSARRADPGVASAGPSNPRTSSAKPGRYARTPSELRPSTRAAPGADRSRARLRGALARRRARRRRMKISARPAPPRRCHPDLPRASPAAGSCAAESRTPLCAPPLDRRASRASATTWEDPPVLPPSPRDFSVPS